MVTVLPSAVMPEISFFSTKSLIAGMVPATFSNLSQNSFMPSMTPAK